MIRFGFYNNCQRLNAKSPIRLYFSMNYRDFSVKSKLIISLFQTVKLSLSISLFQNIGFS